MTLKPPPGPRRQGPSLWQWVVVAVGVLVVIGIATNSGGGGEKKATAARTTRAAADCGDATPLDAAGVVTAYLDGPGSPVVAGKMRCARVADLWTRLQAARRVKVAPYVALERAAARAGWALIDPESPRWRQGDAAFVRAAFARSNGGQDPAFVFARPGAALVFNDLEP